MDKGPEGGCKGFGSGGVGGRGKFRTVCRIFVVSNAYKKKKNGVFLKDALWGGGVPTGAGLVVDKGLDSRGRGLVDGGRPRALVAGEVVGRRGDGSSKVGSPGKGSGKGWLGGRGRCKGFGCGGVGGRGTGPRDGANFATCVHFCVSVQKEEKWLLLKDAGGYARAGRPRALIPGEGVREVGLAGVTR